jgi:hypothetical protein
VGRRTRMRLGKETNEERNSRKGMNEITEVENEDKSET